MAEQDYYAHNEYISYPLLNVAKEKTELIGGGYLPRRGLVDAGFMLGLDSGFEPGQHVVRLESVTRTVTGLSFEFRATSPEMADWAFNFEVPATHKFGTTYYTDAQHDTSLIADPGRGSAFLTLGSLSEYLALTPGTHWLFEPIGTEPGVVQALRRTFARSVAVANDPRRCPTRCCESSSSSAGPDTAHVQASQLIGHIRFREGFNCRIEVRESDNSIQIAAAVGAGAGEPCSDVVIDDDGFRRDEPCQPCDGFVKMVNGAVSKDGKMTLIGGPGVKVTNFPELHKIVVSPEDRAC